MERICRAITSIPGKSNIYVRSCTVLFDGRHSRKLNQTLLTVQREPYEHIGDRIADVVV